MKNIVKQIGIVLIVALYIGATISIYGNSRNLSSILTNNEESGRKIFDTSISTTLFSISTQSEGSETLFNRTISSSYNKFVKSFSAIINASENIFTNAFVQFSFKSSNFLIRFRKSDIIFPFQYFW